METPAGGGLIVHLVSNTLTGTGSGVNLLVVELVELVDGS